jgi:hypothetical protein
MSGVRYPHIEVQLSGEDGNAMFIIARTSKALRRADIPKAEIDAFIAEAMSGDYDHVLQTVMQTVETS